MLRNRNTHPQNDPTAPPRALHIASHRLMTAASGMGEVVPVGMARRKWTHSVTSAVGGAEQFVHGVRPSFRQSLPSAFGSLWGRMSGSVLKIEVEVYQSNI